MAGDLFSAFVLTRTICELRIPGQRPFSAFVLTRTISDGPLVPRIFGVDGLIKINSGGASSVHQGFAPPNW